MSCFHDAAHGIDHDVFLQKLLGFDAVDDEAMDDDGVKGGDTHNKKAVQYFFKVSHSQWCNNLDIITYWDLCSFLCR